MARSRRAHVRTHPLATVHSVTLGFLPARVAALALLRVDLERDPEGRSPKAKPEGGR